MTEQQPEQLPQMKAVFIENFGEIDQLKTGQLNTPFPNSGEIQIKIMNAGVNPVDWKIRTGLLEKKIPHHFPLIPGWDAAGIVSAVGLDVTKFKIGDAIYALCRKSIIQSGTYAEYICYPADDVAFKPTNLSFAQAAAIPLAGLTAWQVLFDTLQLKKGETILIQAGAGGVGSLAIQLAKQVGAFVITTAREVNHDYVKNLGADVIIDYEKQSVKEEIKKLYPEGLSAVFDTLGKEALKESFAYLKTNGKLASIVEQPDEELAKQYQIKSFYVFVTPNGKELQQLTDDLQTGKIQPIPIEELPLEQAAEAQQRSQQGHVKGKLILKVQSE